MHLYFFFFALLVATFSYAEENQLPSVNIIPSTAEQIATGSYPHQFQFINFPTNKEITIAYKRVFKGDPNRYRFVDVISFDEKHAILIKDKKFSTYAINSKGFFPGERVTYRFKLKDGPVLTEASYIPIPVKFSSQNKTFSVSSEILNWHPFSKYQISLEGLEENEVVSVISKSGEAIHKFNYTYQKKAAFFVVSPDLTNKKGGTSTLTIIRKNSDQAQLTLLWGMKCLDRIFDDLGDIIKKAHTARKQRRS